MNIKTRYLNERGEPRFFAIGRDVLLTLLTVAILWAFWPLRTVPTGTRGVVTMGGKVERVIDEGFRWVWPWEVLNVFNVRAESVDIKAAEGGTKDTQPVKVDLTVRYAIFPDKVDEVFTQYSKTGDLDSFIHTASLDAFKEVTGKFKADELIAQREAVRSMMVKDLRQRVLMYGANILAIDTTNFTFAPQYMAAISAKVVEEQQKLAEENKTKRVREQEEQKVVIAIKAADAEKARADGQAYAIKTVAQAEADALRTQNAALRESRDVLELRKIEVDMVKAEAQRKWNGALPTHMYGSAPVPFMNLTPAAAAGK